VIQEPFGSAHPASFLQRARDAGISVFELWVYYYSIGGTCTEIALDGYLHGLLPIPALESMLVEIAVNESCADIDQSPFT
jgi:hypothetical protein